MWVCVAVVGILAKGLSAYDSFQKSIYKKKMCGNSTLFVAPHFDMDHLLIVGTRWALCPPRMTTLTTYILRKSRVWFCWWNHLQQTHRPQGGGSTSKKQVGVPTTYKIENAYINI